MSVIIVNPECVPLGSLVIKPQDFNTADSTI